MPIQRLFLGNSRPPLNLVIDYLLDRTSSGKIADMSKVRVVVPGGRSGRRLLEILVVQAQQRGVLLTPPQIETVGRLPEAFYRPQRPFATELVQHLAWAHCLRNSPADDLRQLVRTPPEADDAIGWLELGQILARLHTELAADGLDFSDVLRQGEQLKEFRESDRWRQLERYQIEYLRLLDSLDLWDVQTARLVAIENKECRTEEAIILVGAADMTITLRGMLDQVAENVTALILAPEEWASRFDPHGCLIPEAWTSVKIPLDERQIHLVDGPEEEADRVARCLADYKGRYRGDEITVGLANESITPFVQRQLTRAGVPTRSAAGTPLAETGVYRLVSALQAYLQSGGYPDFAAFVRHPRVHAWLKGQDAGPRWLERLDEYFSNHLQTLLGDYWPTDDRASQQVKGIYRQITRLVKPLTASVRTPDRWADPIREVLKDLHEDRSWNREDAEDRVTLAALGQVNDVLLELEERIPKELQIRMSPAECLRLVLARLQTGTVAPPADPDAIELLGWLELPLDDAPALVVCSFNEGYVPSSVNSDLFLPDVLRTRVGLQDNARRYARDAYALTVLAGTRESLDLVVAKRNRDGDPLAPSRLLFAEDREAIAKRARRLFQTATPLATLPPLEGRWSAGGKEHAFTVPRPMPSAETITSLSVTAFRDYLACPYRFYLRRVLRLQSMDDSARELDGAMFGSLLHEVLNRFGEPSSPCRDSTEPEEIIAFLESTLADVAAERFGDHPLASVRVQCAQLTARLRAFAVKQAEWTQQGWRIQHTEIPGRDQPPVPFMVDSKPLELRGRIDRIDVHRDTGETFIWDYKSSDSGKAPEQVHQCGGEWVDLQLPLYRHLASHLDITGPVRLGYVLLPKDTRKTEFREADWSEEDLQGADEVAYGVVRDIRERKFWPPTEPPPDFSEEFAAICQDKVFERRLQETVE